MKIFKKRPAQPSFFMVGMEYKAKKTFGNFYKGETYTFIGENGFGRDRITEVYDLFFHDPEKDTLHSWRQDADKIKKMGPVYFVKIGGWDVSVKKSIRPVDLNQFDLSQGKQLLNEYIPYFKSIIEGEKWVLNWIYWITEYGPLLEKILPRMDYLRWKLYPIPEIKKFLEESNVPFNKGTRYLWINNCWFRGDIYEYFNI
ncbi:hypothetical protein [Leptospira santarosai]|uniref:hypothetical protein n=1 Tax=Leptospira santarosai TaxID=28183 RepID=UPI00062D67CE|nr:hypothetical protein [Leptospira santarosai]AVV51239.1 Uncharacterized protein XB17_02660 [Leptospira santarosai]